MRRLTEEDRRLCSLQADVFEASLLHSDDGSAVFVRRFLNSDLARRLDRFGSTNELQTPEQMVREVDTQFGGKPYGSVKFTPGEMHWMGYLYRCWSCMTRMSSKALGKAMPPRKLRTLYLPMHTYDPERSVEEIMELVNVRAYDDVDYGVEVLKRILRERESRG